jgi:hypothetical protein
MFTCSLILSHSNMKAKAYERSRQSRLNMGLNKKGELNLLRRASITFMIPISLSFTAQAKPVQVNDVDLKLTQTPQEPHKSQGPSDILKKE